MKQEGHNVYLTPGNLNLIFIETYDQIRHDAKNILRLDGIWTRADQIKTHNSKIIELYKTCDVVVWQSEYDKVVSTLHWGAPKSGIVIPNGSPTTLVPLTDDIKKFREQFDEIFVCSSNWHRQKRLSENIDFYLLNKDPNKKSALIVLGKNTDVTIDMDTINNSNIYFLNEVSHELCLSIYQIADWMIHLSWRDHCPNVVVEALSQRCPVICTNSGGTKEIVKDNGIIIEDVNDNRIDPYIFDYDNPPNLPIKRILTNKKIKFNESNIPTIEKAYDAYMNIFKEVLK